MKVHEAIKKYIEGEGLKQRNIAKKAGYSEKKFSAMMTGRRKMYADDLVNICTALKVSPEAFIKEFDEEPATKEAI